MTETLYMKDSYVKEFDAAIEEVNGNKIILDKTAFFPRGGGQLNDSGVIKSNGNEYRVERVSKNKGKIYHYLDDHDLEEGQQVNCKIDWNRRYHLMRMHTAVHVLCSLLNKDTGALITGNQIKENETRVDFDAENLNKETAKEYIEKTNEVCSEGHEVSIDFVPREEAMEMPEVVKLANALPPQIEELRIVKIGDVDLQADGGTHVKNTKEIGKIKLTNFKNKGKNNKRVYFELVE